MEYKALLFDLDGTLAPLGKGIPQTIVERLQVLEKKGCRVALVSGKPAYYLCGLLRQLGFIQPLIAGENGTVIQVGIDLPPKVFHILPYPAEVKKAIADLNDLIDENCPGIWYQPNIVGLTPFPRDEAEFTAIQAIIDSHPELTSGLDVYRHCDSFDIMPKGLSKEQGVKAIAELLGIETAQMIAIGDGVNDFPMFKGAGFSIGLNLPEDEYVDKCVADIHEALDVIESMV